jgi:aspartyl protease family protein
MRKLAAFAIIMSLIGVLIATLAKYFPDSLKTDQNKIALIFSIVLITSMSARLIHSDTKWNVLLKQIFGWVVILLLIIVGYSYQFELKQFGNRLRANIIPGYGQGNSDGSVTFYAGENGHFSITALINNQERINFLFDTGASTVALTAQDAEKLGFNLSTLKYNHPLNTANGTSWAAAVTLDSIQVGPITIRGVEATISQEGLDKSLLGMSFLSQLKQFSIKQNILTLSN